MRELNISLNNLNINCQTISDNYSKIKAFVGNSVRCSAVLKKNAYNLGSVPIMGALSKAGCDEFFVHNIEEAVKLREVSLTDKIFVLNTMITGEEADLIRHQAIPVINSIEQYKLLHQFCRRKEKKFSAILNIDTGMNSAGISIEEVNSLQKNEFFNQNIKVLSLLTELVFCSDPENHVSLAQLERINKLKKCFKLPVSIASSKAIILGQKFFCDQIRPGIALYGVDKVYNNTLGLKPAIKLTSKIILVKELLEDQVIGFEHIGKVRAGSVLAVLPIGFGCGVSTLLSNRTSFYINGQEAPVVGNISFDKTVIDVTRVNKNFVHVGADVEIIGENSSLSSLSAISGLNPHEILANLSSNSNKRYVY